MNVVELRDVTKRFGEVVAVRNVSFEVQRGQAVSLLGPSGCGKTTSLRLVAGFEMPDEGAIFIAGQNVLGKRPYERNVGLVFQDYALFPHMTVEQNVAYGLRHRGVDRRKIPNRVRKVVDLVELVGLEQRRPSQLSGGQQQRVALARALATEPEVLLLDEPLSALDAKLREALRVELKQILISTGATTIVVTHDQEEAMSLGDHIVVMDHGKVVQQGSPTEIYARPNSKFVAEFIGRSNWFSGQFGNQVAPGVREFETADGLKLMVPGPDGSVSKPHEICVRPERIAVIQSGEPLSGCSDGRTNVVRGTVVDLSHLGADLHLVVEIESGRRIAVVEKNVGQSLEYKGRQVALKFSVNDCLTVPVDR